jgi:23S rRNA (guanosine2251-2'-O)-methyltransferase
VLENLMTPEAFLEDHDRFRLIALDRVTNPQNVGMIVRSCAAGRIDGIVVAARGNAPLVSPLTIKASAGTLFKLPIIRADSLLETLRKFKEAGTRLYTLDSHASTDYRRLSPAPCSLFILGNESEGVSAEIARLSDERIAIPMNRGVESLNVAVTASLLAFCLPANSES